MRTLIILGAGQFGLACSQLINKNHYSILAFGDNNSALWNTLRGGIPVLSVSEALALNPNTILIGVIDEQRSTALTDQALELGFTGEIMPLQKLYQLLDVRSGTLYRMAARLKEGQVPGVMAELGVYQGDTALQLNALFPHKRLYLLDTFEGFAWDDLVLEKLGKYSRAGLGDFKDTSEELVRSRLPYPEQAVMIKGFFPDTAREIPEESFCLVSLDVDLYAPTLAGLNYFYPRLSPGGMILVHDYDSQRFSGVKKAVSDYESAHHPLALLPLCDLHGTAVIIKPVPPRYKGQ